MRIHQSVEEFHGLNYHAFILYTNVEKHESRYISWSRVLSYWSM